MRREGFVSLDLQNKIESMGGRWRGSLDELRQLKPHPAAELYPEMSAGEFENLCEDVRSFGLQHEIVLCEGMVLDGRHRLRACIAVGHQDVRFKVWKPSGDESPFKTAWSLNGARRQSMTPSQVGSIKYLTLQADAEWQAARARERESANERRKRGMDAAKALVTTDVGRDENSRERDTKIKGSIAARALADAAEIGVTTAQSIVNLAAIAPEKLKDVAAGKVGAEKAYREAVGKEPKGKRVTDTLKLELVVNNNDTSELSSLLREVLEELAPRLATLHADIRKARLESKKLLELVARNGNNAKAFRYLGAAHRYLKEAEEGIASAVPAGVCPKCSGQEPYCDSEKPACGGWISKTEMTNQKERIAQ
jgi:ParB-like chromosome segregation protein Spo0J